VHDFLTVGAAARCRTRARWRSVCPTSLLHEAGGELPAAPRRAVGILERHHFTCYRPLGAYYIMTDISVFGFADDVEFARYLVKDVAWRRCGQSFYKSSTAGRTKLRFCFCNATRRCGSGSADGEARPRWRHAALTAVGIKHKGTILVSFVFGRAQR